MPVQLNHTIVESRDQEASARFLTDVLGLPKATRFGPFLVVELDNGVSLDFAESSAEIATQHYAFLITETEFDEIFVRIRGRGLGRRMMALAERWAAAQGYRHVSLSSQTSRDGAHAFYRGLGYKVYGTSHQFRKTLED